MDKLPNPFIAVHETRFTLDELRFMTEIEPPPDSMTADELMPLLEALTANL